MENKGRELPREKAELTTKLKRQVGVIPIRQGETGLEVLLITSRESRKWIIPKGWPMKGLKDHQAAAREATEEAGIKGKIGKRLVGHYTYQKRLADHVEPCRVSVYRLDVGKEQTKWRERDQRERRWVSLSEAAALVTEPSLARLLTKFAGALSSNGEASTPSNTKLAGVLERPAPGKPEEG